MEQTLHRLCVTEVQKQTNLSKYELCCKVERIIQLLSLMYNLPLNLQKTLHCVLQLLAVGAKKGTQKLDEISHQIFDLISSHLMCEEPTLLSYACCTAIQS